MFAKLTMRFLKLKLGEYEELKRQIKQLADEIEDEIAPMTMISEPENIEVLNQIIDS